MRRFILAALLAGLVGCGGGQHDDLEQFVREAGQGMRGKVEPLPEVKQYEPFPYVAFELPEPFKPRKLKASNNVGSGDGFPDMNRRKEALESYELEKLKMVGSLQQNKVIYALIKAPDNSLHRVKVGNYMGVNFGKITSVNETEVQLLEVIEDSAGEWSEKQSSVTLVEESATGQQQK
ncbi:MAG: pilus assembly protein PilP [Pseudomonadota bacterium]|jgi:type IV pilus assembly protein PilP|nr:pilus assembly protein PilP [Gammaproteobacteria bacterium]MBU1731802.1 pilus assembly protein PilP [Gammaproteobacteria bacterium]MBU1892626.1 pilus assembly protein PilP [Gammaproteobacteria bacterium]